MNDLTIRPPKHAVMLPDNTHWEMRFYVKSETSDRLYVVARNKRTGQWGCSCPGWRRYRYCKHLSSMGILGQTEQRKPIKD